MFTGWVNARVVGWSMQAHMTTQLVADALMMAIWWRGKPDMMLHHSDQGSQCTSEQFQRLLADHGIVCSMSPSGNVWDNSAMESFFSSLKIERTDRKTTAPATRPEQTSSTTSSASTIPCGVTRRSATRAPRSSRWWPYQPRSMSTKPAAAQGVVTIEAADVETVLPL
jgi:putative transposase